MDDNLIPARAVTGLLQEILSALDTGPEVRPARASHVVAALRHLLSGPVPAEGDVISVTAVLTAHIAETPAPLHLQAVTSQPAWRLWRTGETAVPLTEGSEEAVCAAAALIDGPVIIESPAGLEWERKS